MEFAMLKADQILPKILGSFVGCAIGDALGWPVEFDSTIKGGDKRVTELRKTPGHDVAHYTDDTQMTRAIAEALIQGAQNPAASVDGIATDVRERLIEWLNHPDTPNRGPGSACLYGCRNLEKLEIVSRWRETGKPDAKGCGAAMRSSPYGLWFFDDPWKGADFAAEHSKMTHLHPAAEASAAAVSAGCSSIMCNEPIEHLVQRMAAGARVFDESTADMISEAYRYAVMGTPPSEVLDRWRGWTGDEAVAASLYCVLRHSDSYEEAVLEAVNSPGDSDSLGAITGSMMGARLGINAIPTPWVDIIEKRDELFSLAHRFVEGMIMGGHVLPWWK